MFAQQCERTFEVGLSETMSVSSKYYFRIHANIFEIFAKIEAIL